MQRQSLIPGGTLVSKRPARFLPSTPEAWPTTYTHAAGCTIYTDGRLYRDSGGCPRHYGGNPYLDFAHVGVGCCPLGYDNAAIRVAVKGAVKDGVQATLTNIHEEPLAALLLGEAGYPGGGVRLCTTGNDAIQVAVEIGGRPYAHCGYHGWQAKDNPHPLPFNDPLVTVDLLDAWHPATVIVDPFPNEQADRAWLQVIRAWCDENAAWLVFDEVTAGLRQVVDYGVTPDARVYGKCLGNGYPVSAVVGTAEFMARVQYRFLSSTHWSCAVGPAAARAALPLLRAARPTLKRIGDHLVGLWLRLGATVVGPPTYPTPSWGSPARDEAVVRGMLARGFLTGGRVFPCVAHENHLHAYGDALRAVVGGLP